MANYSRAGIGLRPRRRSPGLLNKNEVIGVALHWPGMSKPIRGVKNVKAALKSWQAYHMDSNKWSDIAYQVAFDQDGNRYALRGWTKMSAANGNTTLNKRYAAFLLVLAPGEEPTAKMKAAVRKEVKKHRKRFKKSKVVVGHGDIRPGGTACPGSPTHNAIKRGAFEPKD